MMRWDLVGGVVIAILLVSWVWQVRKRQWSWTGLYVSLGCLVFAMLNAVAPFRGAIDPDYVGYSLGWLRADPGIGVTMVAGPALAASALSAMIAARISRGPALWFVALTCAVFALTVGLPTSIDVLADPNAFRIELGEYFAIPGLVGSGVVLGLVMLPFLVGTVWASRGARAAPSRLLGARTA